ncbi:MAG: DUF368 domain-containing protein [Oceanospirillaceae bacterium]|nr:DUF368 domain-containing protein [Oceanospirillaceae bacterium]
MAMGAADIVPGVSGGTVAMLVGIYTRLVDAIHNIGPATLLQLKREGLKATWRSIDGNFLLVLLSGIFSSVVLFAGLIQFLMSHYPILLWSFFFGLVVISAVLVAKQISAWGIAQVIGVFCGALAAAAISLMAPTEISATPFNLFWGGALAICAMILPGISGSFILLLLGLYAPVIAAVKGMDLPLLAVFAAGCLVGILSFSRVLSWLLHHHFNLTMSVLTGFMAGALVKIWPWKEVLVSRIDSHGQSVPVQEWPILPFEVQDPQILLAILLAGAAIISVLLLERAGKKMASE